MTDSVFDRSKKLACVFWMFKVACIHFVSNVPWRATAGGGPAQQIAIFFVEELFGYSTPRPCQINSMARFPGAVTGRADTSFACAGTNPAPRSCPDDRVCRPGLCVPRLVGSICVVQYVSTRGRRGAAPPPRPAPRSVRFVFPRSPARRCSPHRPSRAAGAAVRSGLFF